MKNKKKVFTKQRLGVCLMVFITIIIITVLSAGCAKNHIKLAEELKKNKYYEEALEHYFKALKSRPHRVDLKIDIDALLKEGSVYYYYLGKEQQQTGNKKKGVFYYKKSLEFDPGNNEARRALNAVLHGEQKIKTIDTVKKEMEINIGLPEILKNPGRLDLEFKTKTSLVNIFAVLSKTGGVNILFDSAYKDQKVKVKLLDVTFYEALARLCRIFKCSYYILDNKNIIITRESAESKKRYKKLLVKNLFFSNVDAGEAKQIIESLFRPERLILNTLTNSLIVSDSVENISLVEKLARFIDKRKGEVEIEVEIMEVDKKKLEEYGTKLSAWQMGAQIQGIEEGLRLNDFYYLGSDDIKISMPGVLWKFFSSITDSKILARPKVRGLDKEKIEIKLGEKRPIPRTTFVPVLSSSIDQQPITSYDMTDVGISLTITPLIHHNREVTLELKFELTYVTDIGSSFVPPTLGNRKVATKLRLRDGETGIIAGLMRGSTTGSREGVPILNRVPIIKEIFSSTGKINERTDILLSITPRVLRMPEITREDVEAYFIGTRDKVELKKWKDYKHTPQNTQKTQKKKENKK